MTKSNLEININAVAQLVKTVWLQSQSKYTQQVVVHCQNYVREHFDDHVDAEENHSNE